MACPSDTQPSFAEKSGDEIDDNDDSIVLSSDQLQRVAQFREEIRLCQTDLDRYEACVRVRNELLADDARVQLLAASCEHVMFTECTEYKKRKERPEKPSNGPSRLDEDDTTHWHRFFGIAKNGLDTKSQCLAALKTVACCWGRDRVQHYQWALKGPKYCNLLRAAAREVPEWDTAVRRLNRSMYDRSQTGRILKRRKVEDTVNPIEQSDLESLRRPSPGERDIDLPSGFGLDKFGLMVHEKYAVPVLSNSTESDESVAHVQSVMEPNSESNPAGVDVAQSAALEATNSEHVLDEHLVNEALDHFLTTGSDDGMTTSQLQSNAASNGAVQDATDSTTRVLRERLQNPSYRDAQVVGGCKSKPKQTKAIVPRAPPPCCPAEVPSVLLASLEDSLLFTEAAEEFSPYIEKLCPPHLRRYAKRASALVSTQQAYSLMENKNGPIVSPAMTTTDALLPPRRRRTASLPDIDWHTSSPKRQRLGELQSYLDVCPKRSDVAGEAQMHNPVTDDMYRKQALLKLEEELEQVTTFDTHGLQTNKLIFDLLQRAEPPNTDEKRGPIEALFLTGTQAAIHVESDKSDLPIFTEGQQQFKWSGHYRPIVELLRRMGDLDPTVSVQIPSRKSTSTSFAGRTLDQVRERFLANKDTNDPWNILDLRSPLPPSTLPSFLTGENCQLLPRIRDTILSGDSAERAVASREQWNEWKDVEEGVLLSQGGNNTAPHKDFLPTWITGQEGQIGFGWMSIPTQREEKEWEADPHHYTGGRWRYAILKPGQTVFFKSTTIHFVFRLHGKQTLGLTGHILQWSGIEQWLQTVTKQVKNPRTTNEDIARRALQYAKAVEKLVSARARCGRAQELGGEEAVSRVLGLVKELEKQAHNYRHPLPG